MDVMFFSSLGQRKIKRVKIAQVTFKYLILRSVLNLISDKWVCNYCVEVFLTCFFSWSSMTLGIEQLTHRIKIKIKIKIKINIKNGGIPADF